ncbi:MAG: hypothetical protein B6D39_00405 [Anaerolineae bacterium UTCFX2]|nr:MAG: hypothetical protein B6D39_00405 [Anaerolineae bacterium UTCFX2]
MEYNIFEIKGQKMRRLYLSIMLITTLLVSPGAEKYGGSAPAASAQPALPAAPAAGSRYTITDLGTLGGDTSQAFGINNKGHVVGLAKLDAQIYHAFFWDGETMTDLGTLGGPQSSATDINDAGQVVGWSHYSGGGNRAFIWQNGVMQNLGTIGGNSSGASGINSVGQVVGSDSFHDDAFSRAFLWQNGSMQILASPGVNHDSATDINDAGQMVGSASFGDPSAAVSHAVLWQNGLFQDLGSLAGESSGAYAINNNGQVVGESLASLVSPFPTHAFVWENGAMQDLGTLGGNFSYAYDINDRGQAVGFSTNAAGIGRAFLWENDGMKDLNGLIPADSGWALVEARAINERGQIVGYGVISGHAHAFLLTPRLPVLVVPGIAGTYASSTTFDRTWLTHRGVHPDDLQIDPLAHVYDDVIQTLKNVGYEEGKSLFVVKYDWRLSPGPVSPSGPFDGHIAGLNAAALSDDQFVYGVDYLGYYLRKASEAYRTTYGGELPAVNIISHSTGGLVARTYIQSDAYGGEYDTANHYKLPEVDQFIMVGVPNRGASKAWNPLHNNWISDIAYRAVLSKIINRAYQKVTAVLPETISGPDYDITKASISPGGSPDPRLFIEKYVPTIRSLLATYDFLDRGSGFTNINSDPAQRNNLVLDLNNGLDLAPTADPNPFAELVNATVICGGLGRTANLVVERTGTAREDVLLPFTDFLANDASAADEWYEDLWMANGGDGTVPLESCYEQFVGDGRVKRKLFYGVGLDHTSMMSDVSVQSYILDTLKVKNQAGNISTGAGLGYANVISVISDPVETILVDGQGRRLGYSQATGVLTEIPGSLWFGEADGFGFVTGAAVDPLHLELTGLGEDYYVMVSVERFGRPAGGAVSSGHLAQGEVLSVPVVITTKYLFLPLIVR